MKKRSQRSPYFARALSRFTSRRLICRTHTFSFLANPLSALVCSTLYLDPKPRFPYLFNAPFLGQERSPEKRVERVQYSTDGKAQEAYPLPVFRNLSVGVTSNIRYFKLPSDYLPAISPFYDSTLNRQSWGMVKIVCLCLQ